MLQPSIRAAPPITASQKDSPKRWAAPSAACTSATVLSLDREAEPCLDEAGGLRVAQAIGPGGPSRLDIAAAILDRVLERGRLVTLDGPSARTRHLNLDEALPQT